MIKSFVNIMCKGNDFMQSKIRFTKEEKEEDIQLVLQGLKEGQSYSQMANDFGRSIQYIADIKKVLLERKLITQEEIDSFSVAASTIVTLKQPVLQRLKEGKNMQEIGVELATSASTISRVRQQLIEDGLITLDEINKANKKISDRKDLKANVLQGLKAGKLSSEISSELKIPPTTISRIKRELISEGLISEQEISYLQSKSLNERNTSTPSPKNASPKNTDSSGLSDEEKQVIALLLQGYSLFHISNTLNIDSFDLANIVNTLKKNRHITSAQINKARSDFKQEEEKQILTYLRRGYSQSEILGELSYLTSATLSRRVGALIASGQITKEQIEQYQYEASQGEKEIMEFVLSKLRLGFTVKEIIEADENGFLTERRVRNTTQKLISQGFISSREIEKAKAKRTNSKRKQDYATCDMQILDMLKQGKSPQEIAGSIAMGRDFVYSRIRVLKQSGKLSAFRKEKIKKKRDSEKKSVNYSEDYKIILAMLKAGHSQKEIAVELGRSSHFVSDRVKELKESKIITSVQIREAAKCVKKSPEKRMDWHLYLDNESLQREITHQNIKSLIQEEGLTTFTSISFIESCKKLFKTNTLSFEDITLLRNAVEYNLPSANNIGLMVRVYISFQQYTEAVKFLNGFIGDLEEDDPLIGMCRKARLSIIHLQKQQQAINLLKSGMPIQQVFPKVGLSESEVIMLSKKITNSDGEPLIRFDEFEIK